MNHSEVSDPPLRYLRSSVESPCLSIPTMRGSGEGGGREASCVGRGERRREGEITLLTDSHCFPSDTLLSSAPVTLTSQLAKPFIDPSLASLLPSAGPLASYRHQPRPPKLLALVSVLHCIIAWLGRGDVSSGTVITDDGGACTAGAEWEGRLPRSSIRGGVAPFRPGSSLQWAEVLRPPPPRHRGPGLVNPSGRLCPVVRVWRGG